MNDNENKEQYVAFLDLLGFKNNIYNNSEVAAYDICRLTRILRDWTTGPAKAENNIKENFNLFNVSDSIVMDSNDVCAIIKQSSIILSEMFLGTTSNFKELPSQTQKIDEYPLLFRGGLTFNPCKDTDFFNAIFIHNGKVSFSGANVFGRSYVDAYKLEGCGGKGPRIFCYKEILDNIPKESPEHDLIMPTNLFIEDKQIGNKQIGNKQIYEIIWPYYLFDIRCSGSPETNLSVYMSKTVLPVAIHLYEYYAIKNSHVLDHYREFVVLVIKAAYLYSVKNKIESNFNNIIKIVSSEFKKIFEEICLGDLKSEVDKNIKDQ